MATGLLLQNPDIQTVVSKLVAASLSRKLGTEVSLGEIRIGIRGTLLLKDLLIKDHRKNDMLAIGRLETSFGWYDRKSREFYVHNISLDKPVFALRYYQGEEMSNIDYLLDHFSSPAKDTVTTTAVSKPWQIRCGGFSMNGGNFIYLDEEYRSPGRSMDYYDLDIQDIDFQVESLAIESDTISGNIQQLSCNEKCGFEIREFSGVVHFTPVGFSVGNLKIVTNKSNLDLDLKMDYDELTAFNDFVNLVKIDAKIRPTQLEMSDIGYFAPELFAMTNLINLEGDYSGTVTNLKGTNMVVNFGKRTEFRGTIRMNGLPDITETFIHASITQFVTTPQDISRFALPGDTSFFLPVPDMLASLGEVSVKGKFTGFYNDFVSKASFRNRMGGLFTDLMVKRLVSGQELAYSGKIDGTNVDLGKVFDQSPLLGRTTFSLIVKGSGLQPENLDVTLKGDIKSIFINGYDYKKMAIDGNFEKQIFNGNLTVNDENLDLLFAGLIDLNDQKPVFDFHSKISHANLYRLNLSDRDSTAILSTVLDFDFTGKNLDNLDGIIHIDSTVYIESGIVYELDNFSLQTYTEPDKRRLSLRSDFIDADFEGKFRFQDLVTSARHFIINYTSVLAIDHNHKNDPVNDQVINFSANLKNTRRLTELFIPALAIADQTVIDGLFDTKNQILDLACFSDYVEIEGVRFDHVTLNAETKENAFYLTLFNDKMYLKAPGDSDTLGIGIDSLLLVTRLKADSVQYNVLWNDLNNTCMNAGDVEGILLLGKNNYMESKFLNVNILVDGTPWSIKPENRWVSDTAGLHFSDVVFMASSSSFGISGGISRNPADSLSLSFNELDISNLDLLIPGNDVDVNGILNGKASLVNLYSNPNFLVDVVLKDLYFNGETFGILRLNTLWNDATQLLDVNLGIIEEGNIGTSEILTLTGDYAPMDEVQNLDFNVRLRNLRTHIFKPFVDEYIDISRESLASGSLRISGTANEPVVTGSLDLARTQVLIKYLNVWYSAGGTLDFMKNEIGVNGLKLYDSKGRQAVTTGTIRHDYFSDFVFEITIDHENFRALNTTAKDNELFYGTAYASGTINISGPLDDIRMDIKARSEKGTRIMIPISSAVSVGENDFILFINSNDTIEEKKQEYTVDLKGLTMNLDLDVTPDAGIEIFMPYNMGTINGKGNGKVVLGINPRGDFSITGEYILTEGEFFFTLEKLIGREFTIVDGSRINWTGSPYDATVDIRAIYPVKTSLAGLNLQTDSTTIANSKVNVKCIISLKDALFNPDIGFSIDFTNVSEDMKHLIFASLDTTDQSVMNQQMISLLVLGSFSYTSASPDVSAAGFKLLSHQLSNWLSKISKDFDIGVNYQPGTALTQEELEVALRTQLFNERLLIDGNFGVKGSTSAQNTSNVVGDINVEYKITEDGRFRVKAFNRTNDISLLEDNAPYTQGVGVFYKKEFENFGDLIRSQEKLKKENSVKKNDSEKKRKESRKSNK